jgi:alkaline phosphatase
MPGRSRGEFVQTLAIALFLLVLAPFSCSQEGITPAFHPASTGTAKNIILFIGDGMGFEQVKEA